MTYTTTRRVLLLTSDGERHPDLEDALHRGGYEIRRCVEPGAGAFPCAALQPGGACPLDDGLVDVALDVRDHPWPNPTATEAGVRCALRARVPVAVAGRSAVNPFEGFADAVVDGFTAPVDACEAAIEASLDRHRCAALEAVTAVLQTHGIDTAPITVSIDRHTGQLFARIIAPVPHELRTTVVVRVGAALRSLDPRARAIEIDLVAD